MIKSEDKIIQSGQEIKTNENGLHSAVVKKNFEDFLKNCYKCREPEDQKLLWKAFDLANKAFEGIKKNSREYYIEHSIAVAKIVTEEIGLGVKSAISALLHDVVDETELQLDDIEQNFGPKTAAILKGLAKVREVLDSQNVVQAEAFRKILLTLSDDLRVIFIKIADRLHHMRTLDAYTHKKQVKTVTESLYVYVPLAHKLGLYNVKTELEDLSLKFKHPDIYAEIDAKISIGEKERTQYITNFSLPIIKSIDEQNIPFEISGRTKSIYSIWSKMQVKNVGFEQVYDVFAIRIVFKPSSLDKEIEECWKIYSIIAQKYKPKPDRIRDWITTPKPNGYEALHVTVLGPKNRWVEVQIRSERMNDVAEIGFAAHWKYKGITDKQSELDLWMKEIKQKLGGTNQSSLDFFDSFNLNIFTSEILVFTPSGEIITLPKDATVLDFAFEIHSSLAYQCIGAKIGRNVVGINHVLSSGDIVEILNSSNQKPTEKWFQYVTTPKARKGLNKLFSNEQQVKVEEGKLLFKNLINKDNILVDNKVIKKILKHYQLTTKKDLYLKIGTKRIEIEDLTTVLKAKATDRLVKYWKVQFSDQETIDKLKRQDTTFEVDEMKLHRFIEISTCCNPRPGDKIIGCERTDGKIFLHRADCQVIKNKEERTCNKIIKAHWAPRELLSQLCRIELSGKDRTGIANQVTSVISSELNVNIKSLHFDTRNEIFYGMVDVYIASDETMEELLKKIKKIEGITSVKRVKEPVKA
jgi:GTP diphosphokinase / guanosine-3',5'-bis(diphosphate) 3'-diphosphatase